MKAARISAPKTWEIMDVETPSISDGECLIQLERWSVCGSDIRHGYGPVLPEEEYPMRTGAPCHECAGTIVESRTDEFKVGDRVIVLPGRGGTGGLVEYLPGTPDRMALVPDDGDLAEWVMCQPSGTVLYSCQKMGTILGKSVVVFGQGSIGLSFTAITARAGARRVIAVDFEDNRLDFAKRFGATHTINPNRDDLDEAIAELTGGQGADISVEAAGYPDALNSAMQHANSDGGKVIIFGIQAGGGDGTVPLNFRAMFQEGITVIPTQGAASPDAIDHIRAMVELKQRGWWDPGEMVTHRMDFDDVKAAYDMYENVEDDVVKVVMNP